MPTGEEIGKDYPTLMPALTDDANIQEAFVMYHYGLTSYTGIETIPEDSIEGHFGAVNDRVTLLEGRPIAGGIFSDTEPTEVGVPPQPVPEGYIWVDSNDVSDFSSAWPTVINSPTDPSASLTSQDFGAIWVDQDGSASGSPSYKPAYIWNGTTWDLLGNQPTVDKFNEYALLAPSASANQTITNTTLTSPTINGASVVSANMSGSVNITASVNITGVLDVQETREKVTSGTISASVLTLNFLDGSIHYVSASPTSNFTVNITNVPTDNDKAITIVAMITQGATGRIPSAVQINGASQTLRWLGGNAPTPTSSAGKIDIFNFTLIRSGSSWIVLGNSSLNF